MYIDVGRIRPVGHPKQGAVEPIERAIGREVLQDLYMVETLSDLQNHIQGLTFEIPYFWIEELPMRLQCHTICIPNRWMQLLCRIARSIACYHEHH